MQQSFPSCKDEVSHNSPLLPSYLEYEVEAILATKITYSNRYYYLVKWLNWSIEESTWEPEENLESSYPMIVEFLKKRSEGEPDFDWSIYPHLSYYWVNKGEEISKKRRGRPQRDLEKYELTDDIKKRKPLPKLKKIKKKEKKVRIKKSEEEEKSSQNESSLNGANIKREMNIDEHHNKTGEVICITNEEKIKEREIEEIEKDEKEENKTMVRMRENEKYEKEHSILCGEKKDKISQILSENNGHKKYQCFETEEESKMQFDQFEEKENGIRNSEMHKFIKTKNNLLCHQEKSKVLELEGPIKPKSQELLEEVQQKTKDYTAFKITGLKRTNETIEYFIREKATKEGSWMSQSELLKKRSLGLAISLIKFYEKKLIFNSELPLIE